MIIDVTDLNLKILNFKRPYDAARKMRAKSIYICECVEIIEVEKDGENIIAKAKVRGSNGRVYNVSLQINENTIYEYSCTCQDYCNGNLCKHVLATSMEIIEPHFPSTKEKKDILLKKIREEKEREHQLFLIRMEEEKKAHEYRLRYADALGALKKFKKDEDIYSKVKLDGKNDLKELYEETKILANMQKSNLPNYSTQIKIEPRVEIRGDDEIFVSFKIGENRMYILRNIQEFCNAFENEKEMYCGKNLRFVAKKENFIEDSQRLLEFIIEYAKLIKYSNKIINNSYGYYSLNPLSGKYMEIAEEKIDDFFAIIKDCNIELSEPYNEGKNVIITDDKIDVFLTLEKIIETKEYRIKINLDKYLYVSTKENVYLAYKNKIYIINKKENNNIEKILEIFSRESEFLIPENKIDEFKNHVFSEIKDYLRGDMLSTEIVKEALVVNKLASKIYLDLDEKENIILELKFCYLDYEFNILDDYKEYIEKNKIVRNVIEEREVLKRLFLDGFELTTNKKYFILKDQDLIYNFLSFKIEEYMNDFEVLVTDKFKNKKIKNVKISNASIKLENGLLELDISKINIDMDEIKDILKNYQIKKKYYKLKNGDYIDLEKNESIEFLNDMQNILDVNYDKLEDGIIKVPVNRGIYLEKILNNNKNINAVRNDEFTKLINNLENKNFSEEIKIDKNYENILRDYQKIGYKWLKVLENYRLGGILADDMGLGKTLQIIALISSELKNKNARPSIVVCPSSLVLNWKAEIEKWAKKIKVLVIRGDAQTRKELINDYEKYNIIITSYDLLKRDIFEYEEKYFKYIIADEAQYIKNFTTQNATALKNLQGETKFALTGTPIENSISELWSIFDFIMPGYLYNYNKFKKKFEIPILKENDEDALKKLKFMITPFILRRIKSEVLTELPDKNITIMNNEMTEEQEKIYLSFFAQTKKEIAEELSVNSFEKSKFKILMLLTRLRQICCHPSLFIENYKGGSGKLNQCMDIVREAIDSGHKILLFSGYTSMFPIIEELLNKEKIKYYKLTGSTQVSQRVEMVEKFNKDENIKVFLISLKAGGTGLNLTGADVVIHYDPWWNVSSENQATDRAYRIGQKNSVQVYKLITVNSIEEKINKLQEKKAKISEQLLSTEEKFINKLSKEEIMELFE